MSPFSDRMAVNHDVLQDHADRHPTWKVGACTALPDDTEVVIGGISMFLFSADRWVDDEEFCRAHAVAHLDLADGRDPADVDCDLADCLANVRLDRDGSR